MNAITIERSMGKVRERKQSLQIEATSLVQRKNIVMLVTQVTIWAWLPISLAAVASQASGHDTGMLGQFLVPGSAAASVIASIWLFINRMAKAGEEHASTIANIMASQENRIKNIMESHSESMALISGKIEENTASVREMNRWIRECTQHINKEKP